jgi:hypothetical protein
MLKLLLGLAVEVFVGVSAGGVILALVVPGLRASSPAGRGDAAAAIVISGVLVAAVAATVFRPGSAIRRYRRR